MASITIKNIDRLIHKLDNIGDMELRDKMNKAVKIVHAQAKLLAPVDTGNLSGSIRMQVKEIPNGVQGRVYTNVEYAPYVEFGTGVKGNGTYPYKVEGLTLTYKDKGWCYWSDKEEKLIYTSGQVAQPYMYPALKNHEKEVLQILKNGIKSELKTCCKGGK